MEDFQSCGLHFFHIKIITSLDEKVVARFRD
jgi:hypothetical protein